MSRARELANLGNNAGGLETLTVSDVTDLSVSASNINSATNQITDSSTDLNVDSNTLVVDKSANSVGIGTTPGDKLQVKGAISSEATNSTNRWMTYTHTDNTYRVNYNGAGNDEVVVKSSGEFGIGDNSPNQKLEIDGDVRISDGRSLFFKRIGDNYGFRIRNESATGTDPYSTGWDGSNKLVFEVVSNTNLQANPGDSSHSVYSNSANQLVLKENGNIGVGTDSPDNPLEVVGSDSGIKITSASTSRPQLRLECGTDEKMVVSANTSYGAIGDSTDTNRYMVFKDGVTGVGTASPNLGASSNIVLHSRKNLLVGDSSTNPNYNIISRNTGQGSIYYFPDAISGSSFWYRLAYLYQRMAYEVTLEWDGGYYAPGSKTFIIQRNWTNAVYASSSTNLGGAGPNFTTARAGGSTASGNWYLDVYATGAAGPYNGYRNQFSFSIRPLSQGIVYETYGGRGSTPSTASSTVSDGVSAQAYSATVSI